MTDPGTATGSDEGRNLGEADFRVRTLAEESAWDPSAPGDAEEEATSEPTSARPPIWWPQSG